MKVGYWSVLGAVLIAGSAPAQEQMGARGFVAQAYIKKTNVRSFRFASPRLLTPDLYDLVQRDGDAAKAWLDYDPLCQCRDSDGLSAQILSVTGTPDQAIAHVVLRYAGDRAPPPQRVSLMLRRSAAGWKIADVVTAKVPSLKTWLAQRVNGAHERTTGR